MVADYACVIKSKKQDRDPLAYEKNRTLRYLFVVTPNDDEVSQSEESWSGQLTMLKSCFAKGNDKMEAGFNWRFD